MQKSGIDTIAHKKLIFLANKNKLNWYICANSTDLVKHFAVLNLKSVSIKSFHCIEIVNFIILQGAL